MNSKTLTTRQLKAIPHIIGSPTYAEGCKKAKLDRTTFYEWSKEPEFKVELGKQRDEVASEAFGILAQSLTKAVESLVSFLDNKDDRLMKLASKDVKLIRRNHEALTQYRTKKNGPSGGE